MILPSPQDIRNAELRQSVAARFRAEFDAALSLTEQALGKGWTPSGKYQLIAHAEADRCRRTGEKPAVAATVYTATKAGQCSMFTLRDDQLVICASYQEGFGDMLNEPDPDRTFTDQKGQVHHLGRFALHWSGYEPDYKPRTPEALAAARVRRQERAVEKEAASSPLFADVIRQEGYVPKGHGR